MSTTRYAMCTRFSILSVADDVRGEMAFQQVLSTKSFRTDRTDKWALPGMASDVPNEIIGASKFSFTETADIKPT